ncbi:uncharacterized protein FSUBG_421 [Fusarium subglutinans]|uniref:Uncharacterized protein n=1 Tax=Gibberella subglutinans TaxID=42677 RepID=A0A8H5QEJ7_GIBSU|nr:uncharacterized protein FSUBG_421 [Fusarium subglutinans]KAF5613809.1 hypothetical protein FSUBG_421 [Fusarium subglutinans]
MSSPIPMPTARQAELHDRFKQYLNRERQGPPIEVLKAAKALVQEEGLNPYHAAHLHMKLAEIPEMGLHHATEGVKILTQLIKTNDSADTEKQLQEATKIMLERQKVETAWIESQSTRPLECRAAALRNRYMVFFYSLEQDQSSPSEQEQKEQDPFMDDSNVKRARTADSGGEKEYKEQKEKEDSYEDAWVILAL